MRISELFSVAFPVLRPQTCQAESAIKKKEEGEDDFDLFGKVLKSRAYKDIDTQKKIEGDDDNGEIFNKVPHPGYRLTCQ
jgi:hypothetical protein